MAPAVILTFVPLSSDGLVMLRPKHARRIRTEVAIFRIEEDMIARPKRVCEGGTNALA